MLRFNTLLFLFLVHILFEHGAAEQTSGARDATIAETLSLIQEADRIIRNSTTKDAIMVQGISGVGKTPFTKWMTQDNAKLKSVQKTEDDPYLMEDDDGTIGKNTLVSATIFPTLYYVNAAPTKSAFYDFPGFEDTRGTNYDIATTYAAKGVLLKTKRAKLIFLVDYDTVKSLAGRTGFRDLLTYISKFVTDINKFEESLAMVISKVPKFNSAGKEISDKQVIDKAADFIKTQVLPVLRNESQNVHLSDEEKTLNGRAMSFVRIILTQTADGDYSRIGLFRLPDRSGPFSDIPLVQNGKKRVEQIIRDLNFTEITTTDFNYVIPDKATINLDKITQEMNRNISSVIEGIGNDIKSLISAKEQSISTDITKLRNETHSMQKRLSDARILANNSSIERCVELVEEHTANLRDFSSSNTRTSIVKSYTRFLSFLQNVNGGDKIARSNASCFQGLETAIRYLDESNKWYTFLTNLYDSLSDYTVQKDITTCKNALPNVNVNEDDQTAIRDKLSAFFKSCVKNNREYDHLHGIHLDASKLKIFNRILNYTLLYPSDLSCDPENPEKLVLKGRYVKFSDIVVDPNVNCSKPIKIIEVFAFNKIFVDASLNKTGANLQLSVMAPIWDIQIEQKIILDGLPGKAHEQTRALDGFHPSGNGTNGKPGLPGNSAGSFLGIGEIFLNVEKLTISANGGDGGPGQDGGDGAEGVNGITYEIDQYTIFWQEFDKSLVRKHIFISKDGTNTINLYEAYPKRNCTYGGNGGAGGKGGYGGQPGVFFIPLIRNASIPHMSNKTGKAGPDGVGGRGGNAGKPGKVFFAKITSITVGQCVFGCYVNRTYSVVNTTDLLICYDGARGSTADVKSNTQSETVSFSRFISTINDYKNYLREDMIYGQNPVNDVFLEIFHNLLENRTHTYYDMSAFIDELYNLEGQFIRLRKDVFVVNDLHDSDHSDGLHRRKLLSFFYESLFKRINLYAANAKRENELSNYLRIAILSKIGIIEDDSNDYLVIDIKNYLQNARLHISEYKNALKEVRRDNQAQRYERIFSEEISRANSIIMEQILPKIDDLMVDTDSKVRSLLAEVNALTANAEKSQQETKDKLRILKNQLQFKYVLGFLQVAGVFLSYAGPVGAAAGGVIGGVGTAIQEVAFDNTPLLTVASKQALKFKELIEKLRTELSSDIDAAERQLNKYKNENPSDQHYVNDINSKLTEKRKMLNSSIAQTSPRALQDIRTELTDLLRDKIRLSEDGKSQTDVRWNKRMKTLNFVSKTLAVGEVVADVYSKFDTYKAEIQATSDGLEKINDFIYKMKKDEREIFDIIPSMANMSKYSNLSDFSQIDLVLFTWQLQSKVKDLQFQIQQMSDQLTIKQDVTHCISKFESAINTMIIIYQHIQHYIRESKLAQYLKTTNSEVKPTENAKLANDFDKLELIIKSNLVMEEYENGVHAFKQYVFPFAHSYLHQFDHLSDKMSSDTNNITILVNEAANQLKKLHDDLEKDQVTIRNKYISHLYFNANFTGTRSFYTWKHEDYKDNIRKLLQGHTVVFESDVKQSSVKNNAIKFNEIGINFKCANSVTQNRLNLQLEHFKINMTHLGNSHYRFKDDFYLIAHEKVQMVHSASKNSNGTYAGENKVYAKIKQNDPLLSPYALWEISLHHQNNNNEFDDDLSSLSNYTSEVIDLVLEGYGSYVTNNIPISGADVRQYYKRSFE